MTKRNGKPDKRAASLESLDLRLRELERYVEAALAAENKALKVVPGGADSQATAECPMNGPLSRDPKHLTTWQAWTYLVDKSRLTKSVRSNSEDALKAWERFTADPILAAVSLSTLKQFRERGRKAGLSPTVMRQYQERVVKIIRQFRPLELPRRGDITTEDRQLTIREAFAKFYAPASAGMAPATLKKCKHDFNWWERFTSNPGIGSIGTDVFDERRRGSRPDSATSRLKR